MGDIAGLVSGLSAAACGCVRMWRVQLLRSVKVREHFGQAKGRMPVCTRMCASRLCFSMNWDRQTEQNKNTKKQVHTNEWRKEEKNKEREEKGLLLLLSLCLVPFCCILYT